MRFPFTLSRAGTASSASKPGPTPLIPTRWLPPWSANAQGGRIREPLRDRRAGSLRRTGRQSICRCRGQRTTRDRAALPPAFLELIGRSLIRRGELVAAIDTESGRLQLYPASSHDIDGSLRSLSGWRYRLNLAGPSRISTRRRIEAAGVVHIMYSRDPERPWRGNGPLQVAQLAGKLSAETVAGARR